VLVRQLGLELLDLTVFGPLAATASLRSLERLVGLLEHLLHPGVNLRRLDAQFIGQVADGLLSANVPPHHLCLLLCRERSPLSGHGMILPWALC
jgi:hypothetical protein